MEPIFLILLALGILFVLVLLVIYAYALHRPAGDAEEYPDTDFSDKAGFRVESLPEDEILTRRRNLLRQGRLAELEFTADPGWDFVLRVCRRGEDLLLDGIPTGFDQRSIFQMDDIRVVLLQNPGGPSLALWSRDGFDYALWFEETEPGLAGGLLESFVVQTVTVSA